MNQNVNDFSKITLFIGFHITNVFIMIFHSKIMAQAIMEFFGAQNKEKVAFW